MKEKIINWLIKNLKVDTNKISDGYHTFEELYEHRIELWMAICRLNKSKCWKTTTHYDYSKWDGWFILGMNTKKGQQITYHLPMRKWESCSEIKTINKAPKFDGHTPYLVLGRIKEIK